MRNSSTNIQWKHISRRWILFRNSLFLRELAKMRHKLRVIQLAENPMSTLLLMFVFKLIYNAWKRYCYREKRGIAMQMLPEDIMAGRSKESSYWKKVISRNTYQSYRKCRNLLTKSLLSLNKLLLSFCPKFWLWLQSSKNILKILKKNPNGTL